MMNRLNCLALIVCLILTGCDNRQANRQANRRPQKKQVTQTFDKKTRDQLRNITGRKSVEKEAEGDQEKGEQKAGKQESPLDRASRNLENQKVVDRQKRKPGKVDVHEALKPLIQKDWQRFGEQYEVWFDPKEKQVIVGGRVSLRAGMLEMFACPVGTNEHESVIATMSDARSIHACLLAVGAIPGTPAYWTEETGVVTAIGPTCEISIVWNDPPTNSADESTEDSAEEETRHEVNAKEFILNERTGETLKDDWVFCGSRLWTDPNDSSYVEYQADGGFMICVTNFPSAMLDLTIESSTSDASRMFVANPDKVPSLGQPVLIVIKPDISTNPDPAVVAAAVKVRDEAQARMNAEMEERMKKREEEWARRDAERKKAKEAANPEANEPDANEPETKEPANGNSNEDSKSDPGSAAKANAGERAKKNNKDESKSNSVEKSTGENEKDESRD